MSGTGDFSARQSVNLYTPELRPKKQPLQAPTALMALASVLLVMVALYGVTQWQSEQARSEQMQMAAQVEALTSQVEHLSKTVESRRERPQQHSQLERMADEISQRRRILADIQVLARRENHGFSAHLEALARQTLDGLWLTGVHLAESGTYVALEGEARSGERVPAYLERLSQEPVFSGSAFESFTLNRPEDRNVINFHMATGVKTAGAGHEL